MKGCTCNLWLNSPHVHYIIQLGDSPTEWHITISHLPCLAAHSSSGHIRKQNLVYGHTILNGLVLKEAKQGQAWLVFGW